MRILSASLTGLLLGIAASAALAAPAATTTPVDTSVTPSDNTHCPPAHAAAHHAPAAHAAAGKHEPAEHHAANPHPHPRAASAPKKADTTAPCR